MQPIEEKFDGDSNCQRPTASFAFSIKLNNIHLERIKAHAERTYPKECCGLLLGCVRGDRKEVVDLWETENVWSEETAVLFDSERSPSSNLSDDRESRYTIAPEEMLRAQKFARSRQLDIIGIYHSHPDNRAVPSEFDRTFAWQHYSYIIISVRQGRAQECYSWQLDRDRQFQQETILRS
jgi:proteasome lid subunit RPN8/RPN11